MTTGGRMSIQEYWREVREIQSGLPEALLVTSIKGDSNTRGGVTLEVDNENAARLIVEGRFRVATPEEIAAHQAEHEVKKRQAQRREYSSKGFAMVVVPSPK